MYFFLFYITKIKYVRHLNICNTYFSFLFLHGTRKIAVLMEVEGEGVRELVLNVGKYGDKCEILSMEILWKFLSHRIRGESGEPVCSAVNLV